MNNSAQLLEQFEARQISAPDFHHKDHILVAFEMLKKYDFVDACNRYACTIRAMAESVGVPEKYNATITIAFMSLIAERKSLFDRDDLDGFIASNPDLLDKSVLKTWYTQERLTSAMARGQFLLPDRVTKQAV